MNSRIARVAPLLFVSGFCALVYQTAWLRELRLIFGASTFASAAVLAIFMAGLGLGSALLGKRVDRWASPLGAYGTLEIIISISAAATPALLWVTREIYLALGGSFSMGLPLATGLRLVFATLVLLVPTVAMGGTLPCIARAAESTTDVDRRGVGILYGVNTFGAVTGAMATTFLLFEIFGTRSSLWMACLLNLLTALAARSMARSPDFASAPPLEVPDTALATPATRTASLAPRWFVLVASGVVGFVFFLMELVWYRMLGPILGGSTFTFGIILAVALAGMGLGGALYSGRTRSRPTLGAFALTCTLEGALVAAPLFLGDRIAIAAALLRPFEAFGFGGLILSWTLIAGVVVLPAAIVSGYQFPLLIALLGRADQQVGRDVGNTYAANTVGAICGSLVVGFYLLPKLGAITTWRAASLLLAFVGLVAIGLEAFRTRRLAGFPVALATGFLVVFLSTSEGPTAAWRHSPIGAGRLELARKSANDLERWRREEQRNILWEREGLESTVALSMQNGFSFIVNGKSDGHAILDSGTQVMSGVLGALMHPNPKQALVVGLGTGSSAGWLGVLPSVDQVDVLEIEPAIIDVAEACSPVNAAALTNPKVNLIMGDAREYLLATDKRYDLVFSEPSNPYRAGIASLFTREFYLASRERLAPEGIFIQWLQAYEIQPLAVRSAIATIAEVFDEVSIWRSSSSDLLIVARRESSAIDVERMRARVLLPAYREALRAAWGVDDVEGVLGTFVASDALVRAFHATDVDLINTDDLNYLEFAFARTVGRQGGLVIGELEEVAKTMNATRPRLLGIVDWDRVELRRHSLRFTAREGVSRRLPADLRPRVQFLSAAASGAIEQAMRLAHEPSGHPESPLERVLRGEVLAFRGEAAAEVVSHELRGEGDVADAELLLGRLLATRKQLPEASTALIAGFEAARTDPWVSLGMLERSLQLAVEIGRQDSTLGRALFEALEPPFSVEILRTLRLNARLRLAGFVDFAGLCGASLAPLEPHFPWEREMLQGRAKCYQKQGGLRADLAWGDLERFLGGEVATFSSGVAQPTPPATKGPM